MTDKELTIKQRITLKNSFERGDLSVFTNFANLAADSDSTFPNCGMYHNFAQAIQRGAMKKYRGLKEIGSVDLKRFDVEITDEKDCLGYRKFRVLRKQVEVKINE